MNTTGNRIKASGVVQAQTDFAYDEGTRVALSPFPVQNDGNTTAPRGNRTSLIRYPNMSDLTQKIVRAFTYDAAGNLVTAQVDCCNQNKFNFDAATQYAYLSSSVRGPDSGQQFTTTFTFNKDNGVLVNSSDENSQQTSFQYDTMYHVTKVIPPLSNGTSTARTTAYVDNTATPQVSTTTDANQLKVLESFDGLGDLTRRDIMNNSDSSTVSTTQFQYDQIWRRNKTSNPYVGSEPILWNAVLYDPLNRVTSVTPPSGGGTTYLYAGNTVLITDPANKQRKNFSDALGRLVRVDEPGWGDALPAIDSVSISGSERSKIVSTRYCAEYTIGNPPRCVDWEFDTSTDYDMGNVTASINGVAYTYPYGQNDTSSTVATNLAGKINSDPSRVVNANPSGSTINLYAVNPGAGGNSISVSTSSVTSNSTEFGSGTTSFPATTFTPDLTGGENAVAQGNAVITATRHLTTTYSYDIFDHLISIAQGAISPINGQQFTGQPRSYHYDPLGRLVTSTTPESGTVTNYYTDSNNAACSGDPSLACRIVDARGITKTLTYNDPVNRLTHVSYSDSTPSVSYTYDVGSSALDRLTTITEGANSQTFSYDNLGRITSVSNVIDGVTYPVNYAYNPASQLTTLIYPSQRQIRPAYDTVGRLSQITDPNSPNPYLSVSSADYTSAGQVAKVTLGNGVIGQFQYNDHLQISGLRYYSPNAPTGSPDVLNLSYDYTSVTQANNNGQIQAIHYFTVPGTEDRTKSESFSYDPWSRLAQAQTLDQTATGTWNLQWTYDRLGNRLSQGGMGNGVTIGQPNFNIDSGTNRIIGYCYDNAGNLTDESTCPAPGTPHRYAYDGANRLISVNNGTASASYSYFGPLRIKKQAGGTTTRYVYSGTTLIAEYPAGSSLTSPTKEYVNAGSRTVATIAGTSVTYHHPDHLSDRAETDSGAVVSRRVAQFPFGETWYESGAPDDLKFSTYVRDTASGETGLDYAIFRHYASGQARFTAPDLLSGSIQIPQSMNRYSYSLNDPVSASDPLGLCGKVTTTTTEYDLNHNVKSKHTTVVDEGPCPSSGGGGGGGGVPPSPAPGPGGGPGLPPHIRDRAKILLSDPACADFLKSVLQNLNQTPDLNTFAGRFDKLTIVPTPDPVNDPYLKGGGTPRTAHVDPYLFPDASATVVHVDNPSSSDLPEVLLHEELHTDPYGFDDLDLAHAAGLMKDVTDRTKSNENKASGAFSKEMEKHCKEKK